MLHDDVKAIRLHDAEFKRCVCDTFDVFALRLAKMVITYGYEQIDLRGKLARQSDPKLYFKGATNRNLLTTTMGIIVSSLSHCLLICLQKEHFCVAAAFNIRGMSEPLIDPKMKADTEKNGQWSTAYIRKHFRSIDPMEFESFFESFAKELQSTQLVLNSGDGETNEKNFQFFCLSLIELPSLIKILSCTRFQAV